ncbi:hypothetical protein C1H46_035609 [Malus baccata]|uniref:Peroxisomal membrane protein 2 n=1 Tax=Malus baccata TaxID=106549 RepID=A0A540KXL5_MALBA|nr:hypothetical protein C1H46_035609 [Malus baccata]
MCTALLTICLWDLCVWYSFQGWTLYEILRHAPQHNWSAYEEALKTNPVLAKMVISGVVYSVGDWIAQCFEGKPLLEFDRTRMLRSGLVGFTLHGSLSHYYYHLCEELIPFQDWWVVPVKVAFDQTVWAAIWNSIYFTVLGFLRFESPISIFSELKATFWPMLTAGWKLWPFAHLVTYGVIPVEQRLLWVDCVELIWVTILSTYSNEKSEARISEAPAEANSSSSDTGPLEAGWKLWPFAHLVTYGVIPVEQRLLWVDCVELIWVTILSTYSNEKSEARISEAPAEANSSSSDTGPLEPINTSLVVRLNSFTYRILVEKLWKN